VGSSFGLLVVLLDVRFVSTDDVNPLSPARQGLRDRVSRRTPILDELRDDRDESSHYGNEFRDAAEDGSHYLKDSLHYLKDSLHYLKDSLHYLSDASHRRFRSEAVRKRLLHRVQDDLACVEGERVPVRRLMGPPGRDFRRVMGPPLSQHEGATGEGGVTLLSQGHGATPELFSPAHGATRSERPEDKPDLSRRRRRSPSGGVDGLQGADDDRREGSAPALVGGAE
jgi:hypothetical protein